MGCNTKMQRYNFIVNIIIWGALWGIFEASVGYFLHYISFPFSFLVWFPAACFFMANVYRKSQKPMSVFAVGLLCAAIKLLNLFLPGRIDKVINPAISIVFESLSMFIIILVAQKLWSHKEKNVFNKAIIAFSINTLWRTFYIIYLAFLVPEWMREISVISSAEKFIPFFITQNLLTSTIIFIAYQFKNFVLNPFEFAENKLRIILSRLPKKRLVIVKSAFAAVMLSLNIFLQFLLK